MQEKQQPFFRRRNEAMHLPLHDRLIVYESHPAIRQLLFDIRSDARGGENLRQNIAATSFILGAEFLNKENRYSITIKETPFGSITQPIIHNPPLLVAIPRGGYPMGQGLERLIKRECLYTNDGAWRKLGASLLPSNFPYGQHIEEVLLTDTVTASGETVDKTIQAMNKSANINSFVYVTAVITPIAIQKLLQTYSNLTIVAGCIEPRTSLIDKDGKQVLFVEGIGDIGDLVSKK